MKALVFTTNFRNADNWMPLFQRIVADGGQCEMLALPWTGDPSHTRFCEIPLPIRRSVGIRSLSPDGLPMDDLKSFLHSDCAGFDVLFLCDMQSYPSSVVLSAMNEFPSRPVVVGLQHGLFQSWWFYNSNFCADFLFVLGERHRQMLEPKLRSRTFVVGLPKLDRLQGLASQNRGYIGYLAQKVPSIEQITPLLREVELAAGMPVYVREHPQHKMLESLVSSGLTRSSSEDELGFLSKADWLITPHSTAGLEGVILGKPVVLVPNAGLTAWAGYPCIASDSTIIDVMAAKDRFFECRGDVDLFLEDVVGGIRFDHTDRALVALEHVLSVAGAHGGRLRRHDPNGIDAKTDVGTKGKDTMQPPFRVVSFYTRHNEYEQHAQRLRESLQKFGIPNDLQGIQESGPWEIICARKARFILECWHASECPVVWLDADATVEQYPALFHQMDADFAVHKWRGVEFGSGTLYFGKSEATRQLLDQWVLRCDADPVTWDQVHLQSAWCDVAATVPLRTEWLPRSYLQIFDASEEEPPVIKHWQASRELKADGRVTGLPRLHYTELGTQLRRLHEPWRSCESSFWIEQGTAHIKPEVGMEFPEGFDVGSVLQDAIDGCFPVLEVGCGTGRIAGLFPASNYVGVDVNPSALIQARLTYPKHLFRIADRGLEYPAAPSALLYTVLLHISDEEIYPFLEAVAQGRNRLVIAEIMDRRWRRLGLPPVFNRDVEDYLLLARRVGFELIHYSKNEYSRYAQIPWNVGKDTRLTILALERRQT